MPRDPYYICQVGTNGSGKTHDSMQIVNLNKRGVVFPAQRYDVYEWIKNLPGKPNHLTLRDGRVNYGKYQRGALVDQAWTVFECMGNQKEQFREALTYLPELAANGGAIIDDAKKYIHAKNVLPGYVADLLIDRRHIATDLVFNVHAYQYLNQDFLSYDPYLVIRYTSTPPKRVWLENLNETKHAEFWECYNRVSKVNADLKKQGKRPIYSEVLQCSP